MQAFYKTATIIMYFCYSSLLDEISIVLIVKCIEHFLMRDSLYVFVMPQRLKRIKKNVSL